MKKKEEEKKAFTPKTLLEPFKPSNLLHALTHPDEVLIKSLKSLTSITGSITGINFNFYSQLRSEAKGKSELTFIGQKKMDEVQLQLFKYNEIEVIETEKIADYNAIDLSDSTNRYWKEA